MFGAHRKVWMFQGTCIFLGLFSSGKSEVTLPEIISASFPVFAPTSSENALCREQSEIYLQELNKLTPWAVNMFDATGKFPSGILHGNVEQYGNYDQCLQIVARSHAPNTHNNGPDIAEKQRGMNTSGEEEEETTKSTVLPSAGEPGHRSAGITKTLKVKGKYCVASAVLKVDEYVTGERRRRLQEMLDQAQSKAYVIGNIDKNNLPLYTPNIFFWGACVPDSCTERDVEAELERRVSPYNGTLGYRVQLRVLPGNCEVRDEQSKPLTLGAKVALGIILVPTLASLLGWILEERLEHSTSTTARLLHAMSLKRNLRALFDVTPVQEDLGCVHGLRAIFLFFLFYVHKSALFLVQSFSNRVDIMTHSESTWTLVMRSFWNYLDGFVFLSGLLTAYFASKKLRDGLSLNVMKMYIRRYYKFTVPLVAVVMSFAYIFPFAFSGPLVLRSAKNFPGMCQGRAWTVFTYLANFDGLEKMCFPPANHVISDMYLYLMAPAVVVALWRHPRRTVAALLVTIATVSVYKCHVILSMQMPLDFFKGITQEQLMPMADYLLFSAVLRIPTYMMGLALGVYLVKINCTLSIPKPVVWLGHCVSLAMMIYCTFHPAYQLDPEYQFDPRDGLSYGVLRPLLWALALAWLVLACATGNAEKFNRICSWSGLYVVSRLSYGINLVQVPIIFYVMSRSRSPTYFTLPTLIDLHEIVLVIAAATFLTVLYLMPLGELWDIFTGQPKSLHTTVPSEKKRL